MDGNRAPVVFVTGIGTGVGKTLVSAGLCKAWNATYWKPIQTGAKETSDRNEVVNKWDVPLEQTLPEWKRFALPASPHYAAEQEKFHIQLADMLLPKIQPMVVEGAGGLLVPINGKETMADLIKYFDLPVILVVQHYLGAINHTLLSLAYCRQKNIPVQALVFCGTPIFDNKEIVRRFHPKLPFLPDLPFLEEPQIEGLKAWAKEAANFQEAPYAW